MFTTILSLVVASLLIGLCISQLDATDREMRFRIKYQGLFNDLKK
jgi:hypothetical protein